MENNNVKTEQSTFEVESLDDILGMPGAESIITPEEDEKNTSVFKKNEEEEIPDVTNIKTEDESEDIIEPKEVDEKESKESENIDDVLQDLTNVEDDLENKTVEESIEVIKSLIDEGTILPFDDDKPIEEYTKDEIKELIKLNIEERENELKGKVSKEFFEALPKELQYAAKYVADGGTDLKELFKTLSQVEEVKNLDISSEEGQAQVAREYLKATNFGSDDEIEEEIEMWKDLGKLEDKASKFKTKLDKMNEEILQYKLKEQEELRAKKEKAIQEYSKSIYDTVGKGKIGDVSLDPETQELLYKGLTETAYPSITGKKTNLFGHLIEKYQFVEPNHELIAEALWLLADPEGYKNKLKTTITNDNTEKIVRKLKTEQANDDSKTVTPDNRKMGKSERRTIKRVNIFKSNNQ